VQTREEKIYEYAQIKMQVEFVSLIQKAFAGVYLPNDEMGKNMADQIDWLLGEVTGIGDLTGTGLGMPRIGHPSGEKIQHD
jgi:hypothetical protein